MTAAQALLVVLAGVMVLFGGVVSVAAVVRYFLERVD